jgi:hypothetical protein
VDLPAIDPKHRAEFRTKLELAAELLRWVKPWPGLLKLPIWVVADGAYAKKEFLKPAAALGMTGVSRLRKDAALRGLPGPKPPGRPGPAPTYGTDVIDLARRAGQRRGRSSDTFELYGEKAVKRSDFCTDPSASVADILGMVADRFSLEIAFRECKQIVGAGQQQVRFLWANIGAYHVCLWTFTLTEAWARGRKDEELVDRSASPWNKASRRPSHADKRRAWRRGLLGEEIRAVLRPGVTEEEIQAAADRLLSLAA